MVKTQKFWWGVVFKTEYHGIRILPNMKVTAKEFYKDSYLLGKKLSYRAKKNLKKGKRNTINSKIKTSTPSDMTYDSPSF